MALSAVSMMPVAAMAQKNETPNVIFILADDLGIGDVGCYGQDRIKTPAVDYMAANGLRFLQHYSGSTVSAPSRCSLMTGKHTGHCYIRGNKGGLVTADGEEFDYSLKTEEVTVAEIMKQKNYATACIGKWGLGGPKTAGDPNKQGFDYFYGYIGQGEAHRYHPNFLWENGEKVMIDKRNYSHDLIADKALQFIEKNANKPFFLYFAPTIPHADIDVPDLGIYDGIFEETPYVNKNKNGKGYMSQPKPNATYASMISRLDKDVQRIMDLLKAKGIADNTLIIFTSDNGNHKEGGHDPEFFNSNSIYRGIKRDLYEGGVRTPFVAYWPAKIKKSTTVSHISSFWDFLPTMCELTGVAKPAGVDGISYLPILTGKGKQQKHEYLYWEFYEKGGKKAVLKDNWKLVELNIGKPGQKITELYDLNTDIGEKNDVASKYPAKVKELQAYLKKAHTESPLWQFQDN